MANNGDGTKNNKSKQRAPRSQFHYFYGSTSDGSAAVAFSPPPLNTKEIEGEDGDHVQNELDSLVGEELISTDNEGEETVDVVNGHSRASKDPTVFSSPPAICGICSIAIVLLIVGGMVVALLFLIPHTSAPLLQTQSFAMPFPQVDRADFGDPVEGFIDMDLFHPNLIAPPGSSQAFVFPFPTGAFWTNLIVPSPQGALSYPIAVYPYAYRWSASSLQVSYPAGHRIVDTQTIQDTFAPDLKLSAVEELTKRYVIQFDPLSVTLRYISTPNSKWETALVQGSPYITLQYLKATPVISPWSVFSNIQCPGDADENFSDLMDDAGENSGQGFSERRQLFGVCSIDDSDPQYTTMRGVQFIFRTPEGANWIMFTSEPINLKFDKIRKTTISAAAAYTGVVRLAYIPSSQKEDEKTFDSSTGLRRLIYHSATYPIGGQVSYDFHSVTPQSSTTKADEVGRHATVTFSYATQSMVAPALKSTSTQSLLMLALPHHAELLAESVKLTTKKFDLNYRCIKGDMTPVVGSSWSYEEPLFNFDFDRNFKVVEGSDRDLILNQVEDDLNRVLPTFSENVYGYGKQVARLAQLAHIAHHLEPTKGSGDNVSSTDSLLGKATKQLSKYLETFLSSDVSDGLVFDSKMGGLVSTNGLHDKGEDFGNGRYNDHHFHYGYFLYAAAILGRIDPSFIERFGPHVDAIFHDVAHATNGDSTSVDSEKMFFPMTRHKSWFDGHSFATGMFPFGNGKSQESSSEAINCYYGAYLWSVVRHHDVASDLTDFSRLLLAMEIRGAKTYWHMLPSDVLGNNTITRPQVYPSKFEGNYMVGNVGMLDVAINTWFGADPLYIHMINAIPITAVTNALFEPSYVQYEYPFLMGSRSSVEMAWRGYTISIHSIIDPERAWKDAQGLISYELDAALSKSQVLYFISQQPGYGRSSITESSSKNGKDEKSSPTQAPSKTIPIKIPSASSSSCENHPNCVAAGLSGECCPTSSNSFLDCCKT
ncbi:glycosyl hydrolase family 81 protein [Nitzschia inconspicua]|uniref:glucan endo-1,3-beta-D-glucosidase n=1 Tax=Nitzschia inconspicua TaxID=303405 RepID=A0A9K3L689_9STRA|nr:glycosyl hydrolase family 81 protein [Nitzschia inconspicua]